MSDTNFIIAFFALLAAGKTIMIVQCLRNRGHSTLSWSSSSSMTDVETGPEVLVEDPMTQRLVLAGEVTLENDRPVQEMIQIPPPAYTIKDEHLEFENDPPPPSFRDVVPSSPSLFSSLSHPPKLRRKPSRSSSSGSHSYNSTQYHRWSRHQLFRYSPPSMDNSSSSNDAAEPISDSGSGVGSPSMTIEPTILRIPNMARWVAESRRDTYMAFSGSPSLERNSFGFESAYPDSDTYYYHSEPHGSSSTEGGGTMNILPSMGALYPSVIVHM
ncbi:hypothetical protein BGZ96_003847 [Linnemannia gamsii]|uniref:Uncharacterized protein n=1 Tax=Linnemannia gamsii TaxID=64522 RepID=A0ABQ7JIS4_9FUNG|nr:hypothetical protein BGZ96_003847 [Linnemannia gamsii]